MSEANVYVLHCIVCCLPVFAITKREQEGVPSCSCVNLFMDPQRRSDLRSVAKTLCYSPAKVHILTELLLSSFALTFMLSILLGRCMCSKWVWFLHAWAPIPGSRLL